MKLFLSIFLMLIYSTAYSENRNHWHGINYKIKTSSFLKSKQYNYEGNQIFPGFINTAWCEGKDDYGVDEWLSLKIVQDIGAINGINLTVTPGLTKSENHFYKNSRPKNIEVTILNKNKSINKMLFTLKDEPQAQVFFLPFIVSSTLNLDVNIKILDVYKGEIYKDTCIAEILLRPGMENKNLTEIEIYLEEEKYIKAETSYIKNNLNKAKLGDQKVINDFLRLSIGFYSKTAEGSEWLSEIYMTLFMNGPVNFMNLLAKQEELIQKQVASSIIYPVTDQFSSKEIEAALMGKSFSTHAKLLSIKILKQM